VYKPALVGDCTVRSHQHVVSDSGPENLYPEDILDDFFRFLPIRGRARDTVSMQDSFISNGGASDSSAKTRSSSHPIQIGMD
jgi:hypothetical protein